MWVETVQGSIHTVVELNAPCLTERIGKLYFDILIEFYSLPRQKNFSGKNLSAKNRSYLGPQSLRYLLDLIPIYVLG